MPEPWFSEIENVSELEQGDLLSDIPAYLPTANREFDLSNGGLIPNQGEVIVLTQSCDLAHKLLPNNPRDPVDRVVVCRVYTLEQFIAEDASRNSSEILEGVRLNRNKRYFMLGPGPASIRDYLSIVALEEIYLLPRQYLEAKTENCSRLRLHSPMRESLSSCFGDLFAKVAIDTPYEIPPQIGAGDSRAKAKDSLGKLSPEVRGIDQ